MYNKKGFFLATILLLLLFFSLAGCGRKQEANSDIWAENKGEREQSIQSGRPQPDAETREITIIEEVPTDKKDLKKLLEDLEKDADKVDLEINEKTLEVDIFGLESNDVIAEPETEEVDVSDIDNL